MKTLTLVLTILVLADFSAMAQGAPKAREFGLQTAIGLTSTAFSPSGSIGAKYWIGEPLALRASFGFSNTSGAGGGTGYDFGAGLEYHFAGKGGVSPYAGGEVGYSGAVPAGGGTAPSQFGVAAVFGGEYFFSSNFSWAGEGQLGFSSSSAGGTTTTVIGTGSFMFILTWYLN